MGQTNDAVVAFPILPLMGRCVIDGHAHNNSGACAPLPLIYAQVESSAPFDPTGIVVLETRETLEALVGVMYADGVALQKMTTSAMGTELAELNIETYRKVSDSMEFSRLRPKQFQIMIDGTRVAKPTDPIITIVVSAMMDMERAHIEGYRGQTIYHEKNGRLFFYKRHSGKQPEDRGGLVDLSHEIIEKKADQSLVLKMKMWWEQLEETIQVAVNHPLHIVPLIFNDPRRYNRPSGTESPDSKEYGAWDEPIKQVATESQEGIFAGIKMYPPLGHKPLDELCEYLPDFYHRCEQEEIPILVHCSPGGMTTHEIEYYREFVQANEAWRSEMQLKQRQKQEALKGGVKKTPQSAGSVDYTIKPSQPQSEHLVITDNATWFFHHYVSPEAWKPVLENFPKLKLCLAHFGGSEWRTADQKTWINGVPSPWIQGIIDLTRYENVYTDLSCFNLDIKLHEDSHTVADSLETLLRKLGRDAYKHLREKIIYGTDWYLTHLTRVDEGAEYAHYCHTMKRFFDSISRRLWLRFSLLNPWKFYGLDKKKKLENMAEALRKANARKKVVNARLEQLYRIGDEVEDTNRRLTAWEKQYGYQ